MKAQRDLTVRGRQREKGVAIILSLGVLALMIIYTFSFAMAALNNQRFAKLNRSLTEVRTICEAKLNLIKSRMAVDFRNTTSEAVYYPGTDITLMAKGSGTAWSDFYFAGSTANTAMTDGLASVIADDIDGLSVVPDTLPSNYALSWIPIIESRIMDSNPVNVLIGRYAYLLIDESGKLDPNVIVDSNVSTGVAIAEGSEPLRGYFVSELNATTAGVSPTLAARLANKPDNAEWFSHLHIKRVLGISSQADITTLRKVLFPHSMTDIIEPLPQNAFLLSDLPDTTVDAVVSGIPWLKNWNMAGNFSTIEARAKNLAANLIDYTDADGNATRDNDSNPTYWGTEKVPYLSRVAFRLQNKSYLTSGNSRTQPVLRISCRPELTNGFGDLSDKYTNCYVNVQVRVTAKNTDGAETSRLLTFEFNPMIASFTSSGYYPGPVAFSAPQSSNLVLVNQPGMFALSNIKLIVERMVVKSADGTEWWDFGRTNYNEELELPEIDDFAYVGFEALNPVANLHADEWKPIGPYGYDPLTVGASLGQWWIDHPIHIRNALMRHEVEVGEILRMEPFTEENAEDGYRTFNLIDYKYDEYPDVPGLYSDASDSIVYDLDDDPEENELNGGDRNILDMVKVDPASGTMRQVRGRVNINTPHKPVLQALFKRVTDRRYTGGAAIDPAKIDAFIDKLMIATGTNPVPIGLYSNYRNPPLYGCLFTDEIADGLTESEREYLLVLTQQLISGEHNFFTLYVIAQQIDDRGKPGTDSEEINIDGQWCQYGRYDLGADRIVSEQKIKAILYRNAFTNEITVLRRQYLSE